MSDSAYPAFPVLALLGALLVLIPLPWHFQALNSGTCLYMIWTSLACLNLGVNAVVWRDSAIDFAPVWCDISSRIIVATAVAIPAASLCINRRLYYIATMKSVHVSPADKRRAVLIDLSIGLGIPFSQIFFQYVVSGHRFDIFEQIGCYPYTFNTAAAYPLSILWPIVIGLVSAVYCILTLRAFFRRRAQFNEYLTANSSLTVNRYFRLMALASVELLCTIPLSSYGIYLNVTAAPLNPWISWSNVHYDYAQVDLYPAVLWRPYYNNVVAFGLSTWSAPFCAFVFFGFFGFASEARKNYRKCWSLVAKHVPARFLPPCSNGIPLFRRSGFFASTKEAGSLPVFVPRSSLSPPALSSASTFDTYAKTSSCFGDTPTYE